MVGLDLHASTLRLLTALPALSMRRAVLGERIAGLPPGDAAGLLHALFCHARAGHPAAEDAVLGFALDVIALHREGGASRFDPLREAASREGYAAVAAVLAEGAPRRSLARRGRLREVYIPEEKLIELPQKVLPPGAGGNLHALAAMRLHPSPLFIGRLLRQRWLRLEDALVIASRRPTSAPIVFAIAAAEHWMRRLEVRTAIAENPFTPAEIALCLLPTLRRPALDEIRGGGFAAEEVRRAAALLLAGPG